MNPIHRIAIANDHLFNEAAQVTLSLDTVYLFYAVAVVAAAALWIAGVVCFGSRGETAARSNPVTTSCDRATPVAP